MPTPPRPHTHSPAHPSSSTQTQSCSTFLLLHHLSPLLGSMGFLKLLVPKVFVCDWINIGTVRMVAIWKDHSMWFPSPFLFQIDEQCGTWGSGWSPPAFKCFWDTSWFSPDEASKLHQMEGLGHAGPKSGGEWVPPPPWLKSPMSSDSTWLSLQPLQHLLPTHSQLLPFS